MFWILIHYRSPSNSNNYPYVIRTSWALPSPSRIYLDTALYIDAIPALVTTILFLNTLQIWPSGFYYSSHFFSDELYILPEAFRFNEFIKIHLVTSVVELNCMTVSISVIEDRLNLAIGFISTETHHSSIITTFSSPKSKQWVLCMWNAITKTEDVEQHHHDVRHFGALGPYRISGLLLIAKFSHCTVLISDSIHQLTLYIF